VKAEINVTPLVDIVLVLLIIFIVITPAVDSSVRLPAARHGAGPDPGDRSGRLTLVLTAHRDPAGRVDGPGLVTVEARAGEAPAAFALDAPGGRDRLAGLVRQAVAGTRAPRVFLKADLDLPFKHVDAVLQLCREAGAGEASVVTREERAAGPGGG